MNFSVSKAADGSIVLSWVEPQQFGHGYGMTTLNLTQHIEEIVRRVVREKMSKPAPGQGAAA